MGIWGAADRAAADPVWEVGAGGNGVVEDAVRGVPGGGSGDAEVDDIL